jgi:hypothetical protein
MVGSTWFSDHFWDELAERGIVYINVDSPGLVGATEYNTRSSSELLSFHRAVESEALPGVHCRRVRLTRIGDMSFVGVGIPTLSPRSAYPEAQVKAWNGAELGPWHHSIEMTLETVEQSVLQKDLHVYATMVTRLSNEPILPYDFTSVAEEMDTRLTALLPKAPERLRLDVVQARAREFRGLVSELMSAVNSLRPGARWPLSRKAMTANAGLLRLSRTLNAPTSTVSGRWDQDLYGLSALRTVFPALYTIETLGAAPDGSVDRRLAMTRLVRNRNWIADSIVEAIATVRSTLKELT